MEIVQMYNDVPAIELGIGDHSSESFQFYDYNPSGEPSQYWRSIDPGLYSSPSFEAHQIDRSAHLVNMEKHILNLSHAAYGYNRSPLFPNSKEDSPQLGLSTMWGPGGEALRKMRHASPDRSLSGSLCSTNSTSSDYAFSPDVSRNSVPLYCNETNSRFSFGSPYPVSFSQSPYSFTSQGSFSGPLIALSPVTREQAAACTMKELQYTPDPENDETPDTDCMITDTIRPDHVALTPESCCLITASTPSRSDYHDSIKDEDPESPSRRSQPRRRISYDKAHPARSPTVSRKSSTRATMADSNNKILKSSQRQVNPTKNKTKTVSRSRSNNKSGSNRPFVCSFSHYGCESRFSSKNEWKRHVSSQHLQLGFYRCDAAPCNPTSHPQMGGSRTYNDFNRKDLFTQHHRRMHTPWTPANKPPSKKANDDFEEGLEEVRRRCWQERRQAPKRSRCIFCSLQFEGDGAWEERMEHIGKHFEKEEREKISLGDGEEDKELRVWALQQGIVVDHGDGGCWLENVPASGGKGRVMTGAVTRRGRVADVADVEEDAVGDDE